MPIKIIKTCKHCGEPIEQDDYFEDWFHTGRADAPTDLLCDPTKPGRGGNFAQPSITVVPRGESNGN